MTTAKPEIPQVIRRLLVKDGIEIEEIYQRQKFLGKGANARVYGEGKGRAAPLEPLLQV